MRSAVHGGVLTGLCVQDRAVRKRHPYTSVWANTQDLRRPSRYAVRAWAWAPCHLYIVKSSLGRDVRQICYRLHSSLDLPIKGKGTTTHFRKHGKSSWHRGFFGSSHWIFLLPSVLARPRSTIKSSNSDISLSEQKTREFYIPLGHILFTAAGSGGQSPRELGKHDVWRSLHETCNESWCTVPNNAVDKLWLGKS